MCIHVCVQSSDEEKPSNVKRKMCLCGISFNDMVLRLIIAFVEVLLKFVTIIKTNHIIIILTNVHKIM